MNSIIVVLMIIITIGGMLVIHSLYKHGEAHEWFQYNTRQFVKHFRGEDVTTHVNLYEGFVEFYFRGHGQSHTLKKTIVEAKKIYDQTRDGGIRKRLLRK